MIKLPRFLRRLIGTQGEIAPRKVYMPLFVTGCMRSGTTFLVDKLTSHPQLLKIGDELNQVWTEIGGAEIEGTCKHKSAKDANSYYTYQMGHYFFNFINKSKGIKRSLMRASFYLNTRRGRIQYDWENIIPVNKSTHLMNKIGYLNTSFPKSKIIIIVRDIYAHCSSMKMHFLSQNKKNDIIAFRTEAELDCWSIRKEGEVEDNLKDRPSFPPDFRLIPEMWFNLNKQALEVAKSIDSNDVIVLSYEDLVNNQEKVLHKVFDFLSLESKHQKEVDKICSSQIKHTNTTTKGNSLDKWKNYLSEEEIEIIQNTIENNKSDYNFIVENL